jgi:hypothetical protein
MSYGVAASGMGKTMLMVELPWDCGTYTPMINHHCPLASSENSKVTRGHDTLRFYCTGGGNRRSVTSIMTKHCGRFTISTFMNPISGRGWQATEHFAELTTPNGKCITCKDQPITRDYGDTAVFKININPRAK